MENPRPEKVAVVDEVKSKLDSSSGAILTEYRGLKVSELAELRRALRAAGGEYKIYKNTLVRFAVADLGLTELNEMLTGPTAIAFVDGDAAAVAKALRDYSRTNPNLVVKGGLLGGNILSSGGAAALADLPSREVLLARLAGGLAAPLQKMAGLLQALPRNFAYGLKALIDQGGAPGAPQAEAPAPEAPAPETPASESEAASAEAPEAEAPAAEAATSEAPAAEAPASETPADETAIEAAEAAAPRVDETSDGPASAPAAEAEPAATEAQTEASTGAETEASTDAETEQ
jgi:large subunit ribosomal protein L10